MDLAARLNGVKSLSFTRRLCRDNLFIPSCIQRITRRQGGGDEAYCTYVEEVDDAANKVSRRPGVHPEGDHIEKNIFHLPVITVHRAVTYMRLGIIVIALFGLFSTQAIAASFDCKTATTWVEKTVCSNPELSQLDEEMAKAYHDALASLSPEGQKETKQYQKQWLKNLSPYCEAELKAEWVREKAKCLKKAYKKRTKQLQESLIKFPDRIFRNVYVDASEIDNDCVGNPYIDVEFSYPQIENPRSENEKFWNNLVFQKAKKFITDDEKRKGACVDSNGSYIIEFTNMHLISYKDAYYQYDHGTPHGYASIQFFNWLLEAKRKIEVSDLFNDKTNWRNKLVSLVAQKKKEQETADQSTYTVYGEYLESGLINADKLMSLNNWMISREGLVLRLNAWDGSHYVLFTIDWKILNPYLSKNGHSLIFD